MALADPLVPFSGPNVASGSASVVYSTEAQVNYIVKMIGAQVKYGIKSFECKVEVEKQYNEYIQNRLSEFSFRHRAHVAAQC